MEAGPRPNVPKLTQSSLQSPGKLREAPGLSISIEGEPRRARTGVSGDTAPLYGSAEELARVAGIYEEEMGSEEEEAPAYGNITPAETGGRFRV